MSKLHADLQRLRVERTLEVVAGFKALYFFIEGLRACAYRAVKVLRSIGVSQPGLIEHVGDCFWNHATDLLRLRSVTGQGAVKKDEIGRHLRDFVTLHIMR